MPSLDVLGSMSYLNDQPAGILVLGYGNPLCTDDAVGWHVVEALEGRLPDGSTATFHQLTPEWAEPISAARHVIFVDAAVDGVPGEVHCFPIAAAAGRPGSHETTPDGLLSMAGDLFGRCPPAHMVTIAGDSFEISESLTPAVAAAVPLAVAQIYELIEQLNIAEAPPMA